MCKHSPSTKKYEYELSHSRRHQISSHMSRGPSKITQLRTVFSTVTSVSHILWIFFVFDYFHDLRVLTVSWFVNIQIQTDLVTWWCMQCNKVIKCASKLHSTILHNKLTWQGNNQATTSETFKIFMLQPQKYKNTYHCSAKTNLHKILFFYSTWLITIRNGAKWKTIKIIIRMTNEKGDENTKQNTRQIAVLVIEILNEWYSPSLRAETQRNIHQHKKTCNMFVVL